jgi:hypothetical protein
MWVEAVREEAVEYLERTPAHGTDAAPAPLTEAEFSSFIRRATDRLLAADPHFAHLVRLPADVRQRELHFNRQTLWGILDYLARRAAA